MNNEQFLNNVKITKQEFIKSYKCLLNKKPLKSTRNKHILILLNSYNKIVLFYTDRQNLSEFYKNKIVKLLAKIKGKLQIIFSQFELKIDIPLGIAYIKIDEAKLEQEDGNISLIEELETSAKEQEEEEEKLYLGSESESNDLDSDTDIGEEQLTMAQELSTLDFLKICSAQINRNYTGDPLGLQSFINSVDLLSSLATYPQLQEFLVSFLKTKLEGKALEALSLDTTTVEDLKTQLKNKIKPESSKIVEGRMLALRMTKQSIQDFAKEAELLADSLKRAFITEGIPEVNSQRMTTEKTVEMCKLSAKSDTVRTCLAAASFSDPKEVIAKLITETNSDNTHRQVLAYERINHSRGNNNHRGQYNNYRNYNFRGQRGRPNNFRQ